MARVFPYDATRESLYRPCRAPFFDGWRPVSEAALCCELSRLAYCDRVRIEAGLAVVGLRLESVVSEADGRGAFGFLARDDRSAVLAFRGTESEDPTDVIDDARFLPVPWTAGGARAGSVHAGFADALERVWPQVADAVRGLAIPLLFTGHSLGAALAVLTASRVPGRRLITFGGPRVGDADFCRHTGARLPADRYQHCADLVCQVPPQPPYFHFGTLHYIDRGGRQHVDPEGWMTAADQAAAHAEYVRDHAWRRGNLVTRSLADHTPRNYVSALAFIPGNAAAGRGSSHTPFESFRSTDVEKNTIVTLRQLDQALVGVATPRPAEATGFESTEAPAEQDVAAWLNFHRALRAIEREDAGDGVLVAPTDPVASLLQSYLAEQSEETGRVEGLPAGGFEAKFDTRDILGWVGSFFQWWRRIRPHAWRDAPEGASPLGDRVRIGLLADWGTGLYGAPICADTIGKDPDGFDLLMHLGDVYYSGTEKEIRRRFLPHWPKAAKFAHLALNSNHEMYSGGYGYFDVAIPAFAELSAGFRQQASHFALQNDHFTLVGLDTGYEDHDLAGDQANWLRRVVAAAGNRKVILFSHHQPYSLLESQGTALVARVRDLLDGQRIFAWYWGHEHRLVVYEPHPRWGLRGRCLGHGGMPYFRDRLPAASPDRTALYSLPGRTTDGITAPAGQVLDGPNPYVKGHERKYGPNGYVVLTLDGADAVESFRLPDGTVILEQPLR